MYRELLFFPERMKGDSIYPDEARKLVAKSCDAREIDPRIFARYPAGTIIKDKDMSGKTMHGETGSHLRGDKIGIPNPIIFDGGKGFIRLYGLGKTGSDLLMAESSHLMSAVFAHLGPCRVEMREGECSLKGSRPQLYSIRRLVVAKKSTQPGRSHFGAFKKPLQDCITEVRAEIIRGIVGTARFLDTESGRLANGIEARLPLDDDMDLDVIEGESVPIEIKPGILGVAFKNVTFRWHYDLNGPWGPASCARAVMD